MTTTIAQTIVSPWLTPVRVVATINIPGIYANGPRNDGVNATLTIAVSSLIIDYVLLQVADRVLLSAQTNDNENGIYVIKSIDSTSSIVIIERASDQQSLEQYKIGQYVSVGAGTDHAGNTFAIVEPLPAQLGVNDLSWVPTATSGGGGGVVLPTVAGNIAHFTDTIGTISSDAGNVTNAGNIGAGSDGISGSLISYPSTTSSGFLALAAADNNSGNFTTTISNATNILQSQTISIPSVGSSSGVFILDNSVPGMGQAIAGDIQISDGLLVIGNAAGFGQANSLINFSSKSFFSGTLSIEFADNAGNYTTLITNQSQGQATTFTILDPANAAARFLIGATNTPFINGNFPKASGTGGLMVDSGVSPSALSTLYTTVDVTVLASDLAASGSVYVAPMDSNAYILRNVIVNLSTGMSGGGGDRTIIVSNGNGILAQVSAALVGTPINTLWGGTDLTYASGIPINDNSGPGNGLYISYFGGSSDYATGSIKLTISYTKA